MTYPKRVSHAAGNHRRAWISGIRYRHFVTELAQRFTDQTECVPTSVAIRISSEFAKCDAENWLAMRGSIRRSYTPIEHRSVEMQRSLNVIRARDVLVRMRTMAVNAVRGPVKPCGYRLPICSTESFAGQCRADLLQDLLQIAEQLLK
jgi:hypothetical protein